MNNKITFNQVMAALEENNEPHVILTLSDEVRLVLSPRGARILGPFLTSTGESICWLNPAWAHPTSFKELLTSGNWNLGGDRIWIAPEIQYLVRDRSDFWGTVRVPPQMDPGRYTLEPAGSHRYRLAQTLTMPAFNLASGEKDLAIDVLISPAANPLRALASYSALMEELVFAGYEHTITLSETKLDDKMSESWLLVQLNPGGELLIPASPHVEYSDYFEPIDTAYQTIRSGCIQLQITGNRRYKVGYKAAHVFGRLGYFNRLDDGRAYLIVRTFFSNPAAPYVEEPPNQPGRRGHSIHVYNDGGALGGFGELECNGQTIGGETGRSSSVDRFVLWLYVGPVNRVKKLVPHLLGVEL